MNIDREKAREAVRRGTSFGFIPHRLEIIWKPELNHYPYNVLFASQTMRNGEQISGSAIYEPDFHTYEDGESESSMRYHNIHGGTCYLTITYNKQKSSYRGEKFVNGESVCTAFGGDWKQFFTHFTMTGLVTNEMCRFDSEARQRR